MMPSDPNGGVCLIRRVVIRNYKSIAACDVELGPLTFLVGPNGSGKSNFLDALAFVGDALRNSLDHAIRFRGGLVNVLRRSFPTVPDFGIRVEFQFPSGTYGYLAFSVGTEANGFVVDHEECFVSYRFLDRVEDTHFYQVSQGSVVASSLAMEPAALADRLYLINVSGTPAFRPVYDVLSAMGFYSLNPDAMRDLQPPHPGEILARDGANLPSILARLSANVPALKSRIEEYLAQVVPGISEVGTITLGSRETIGVWQEVGGMGEAFQASSLSDGTLRALGILTALFQGSDADRGPLLVGIEEPETALHPAATAVLIDAMRDAVSMRQVLVTSHSPELLDNPLIGDSEILAVVTEDSTTRIGHLDEAGRSVLRDHLFTAGDLLRMNQLRPDPSAQSLTPDDVVLFGTGAPA
ncbi:MAG TPA: AAA family ATPase [Longimicrobium sp.]